MNNVFLNLYLKPNSYMFQAPGCKGCTPQCICPGQRGELVSFVKIDRRARLL